MFNPASSLIHSSTFPPNHPLPLPLQTHYTHSSFPSLCIPTHFSPSLSLSHKFLLSTSLPIHQPTHTLTHLPTHPLHLYTNAIHTHSTHTPHSCHCVFSSNFLLSTYLHPPYLPIHLPTHTLTHLPNPSLPFHLCIYVKRTSRHYVSLSRVSALQRF